MGAEKVAAFYESWNAMFAEAVRANLRFCFSPLFWSPWGSVRRAGAVPGTWKALRLPY